MPFVESLPEFETRNNAGPPFIVRGRLLFRNGAQSDGNYNHRDPPDDVEQRIALKREYLQTKLAQTLPKYANARQAVNSQLEAYRTGNAPHPDETMPGWAEHLKGEAVEILRMQTELAALTTKSPMRCALARQNDEIAAQQQQRTEQAAKQLQSLPTF